MKVYELLGMTALLKNSCKAIFIMIHINAILVQSVFGQRLADYSEGVDRVAGRIFSAELPPRLSGN
jgi:hypothetical protein